MTEAASTPWRGLGQWSLWRLTWTTAAIVFIVYFASPVMVQTDSIWSIPTAASLLHERNADLDEYSLAIARQPHGIVRVGEHAYAFFPHATSWVALPFVAISDALVHVAQWFFPLEALSRWEVQFHGASDVAYGVFRPVEHLVASFVVAASAAVLFAAMRRRTSLEVSWVLAGIYAFGTTAYSTASRVLWQHGPSMLAVALVMWLLLATNDKGRKFWLLGVAVASAYVLRPTNSVSVFALTMFLLVYHRRYLLPFVLGMLCIAVPFVAYNFSVFHAVLPPYYLPDRLAVGASSFGEALLGNLVSPSRGLLTFTPVLVFGLVSAAWRALKGQLNRFDVLFGGILIAHWLVISSFPHWWAGHSVGPRFFTDVLPYCVWFLLPPVEYLANHWRARPGLAVVFALCVVFGLVVHGRASMSFKVHRWNDGPPGVDEAPWRVWDWRDPQFLR